MEKISTKKIGVALGGGTIRGLTHIGCLEILDEKDVPVDVLVGCSSGAVIAAAYATGKLPELKEISLSLRKSDRRKMLDFCLTGEGIIRGKKLKSFFNYITAEKKFEDIKHLKLAFVGTDALTGKEVVIDRGSIADALEITTALPGISPLKRYENRIVFDGGTAMLVPAKIAYDLGADKVIAVDVSVNRSIVTRAVGDLRELLRESAIGRVAGSVIKAKERIMDLDERHFWGKARDLMKRIKLLDDFESHDFNFIESYLIGLRAISRDYKRGLFNDKDADVAIHPDVLHIKRVDVTKTQLMIEEGRKAAEVKLDEINQLFK